MGLSNSGSYTVVRPGSEEAVTLADGRKVESAKIPQGYVRVKESGQVVPDNELLIAQHCAALDQRKAAHAALAPDTGDRAQAEAAMSVANKAFARIAELEKRLAAGDGGKHDQKHPPKA